MKKLLLSFVAFATTLVGVAQVSFYVNPPSANSGNYSVNTVFDLAEWSSPDMSIPANAVDDTLAIVQGLDSLGCDPLTNGPDVNGKIALVWRGACQFGDKAFNAQNAGAVAVLIVNNDPNTDPTSFTMLGGTNGLNVTIPVGMISTQTGQLLYDEITSGNVVTAFLGNKLGYFDNDLGIAQKDVLRARQFALPIDLAPNDTEFSVPLGGWVFNFGADAQTGVTLNAEVTVGGTVVYSETSTPINSLASGDSAWIPLPVFSQATYSKDYYSIVYTVDADLTDDFPDDNDLNADFMLTDEIVTYARVDQATNLPIAVQYFQPGTFSSSYGNCIHFMNSNVDGKVATGITFAATSRTDTELGGEFVGLEAYEWGDAVTTFGDPAFDISDLTLVGSGEFVFTTDSQQVAIYQAFDEPVELQADQPYVFCVTSGSQDVFLGYDNALDYEQNIRGEDANGNVHGDGYVTTMVQNDGTYTPLGFGTDLASAIAVHIVSPNSVDENAITIEKAAFPNPAVHTITVPLTGITGAGTLQIVDLTGKVILVDQVNAGQNQLTVDVSDMAAGMYVFNLALENGKVSSFNVVVSK